MNSNISVSQQKAMLDSWYQSMKAFDYDQADMKKEKIESSLAEYISDPELQKLYQLFLVRYHILHYEIKKASETFKQIDPYKDDKNHWLNYYYYFFKAFIYLELKDRKSAINYLLEAKRFISDVSIEEAAEFYYKLSVAYTKDYQYSRSIKYANRALDIFINKSNFKRMSDCENLLGINNRHLFDKTKALTHFKKALLYTEKIDRKSTKARILHNIGLLHADLNEMDKAIDFLYQAFVIQPPEDKYGQCQNLFILARSYFTVGSAEEAMSYLNKGLTLTQECGYLDYYYHFKILQVKHIEPESLNFEKIYKEGIAYFNDHEEWEYVMEFSEELAIHLRNKEKHKESVHYFKLAVDAKKKHLM